MTKSYVAGGLYKLEIISNECDKRQISAARGVYGVPVYSIESGVDSPIQPGKHSFIDHIAVGDTFVFLDSANNVDWLIEVIAGGKRGLVDGKILRGCRRIETTAT